MATGIINVLGIVDTTNIGAGGNTWYLVDDDNASSNEGSQSLNTLCGAGDTLYFRVISCTEGAAVTITAVGAGPSGAYVFGFNSPQNLGNGLWSWQTQNQGSGSYALHLLVNSVQSYQIFGFVKAGAPTLAAEKGQPPVVKAAQAVPSASTDWAGPHQIIDIVAAIDTQAVMAGGSELYMVDNNPSLSTGEGSLELNTGCTSGSTLRWHCVAINGVDTVVITGLQQSQPNGGVFGGNSPSQVGNQWQWQTQTQGSETYQIRILINGAFSHSWDPFVTCTPA